MPSRPATAFDTAIAQLEPVLAGPARREMAAALAEEPTIGAALTRLRASFSANAFTLAGHRFTLDEAVSVMDRETRKEGFHVLHDWDGKSDRVNEQSIPMDVLDYIVRLRGSDAPDEAVIAILLDYYFVHLLELCSLRAWDEGDPDANLDRLTTLLDALQGTEGSGQRFVSDVETLILIATSHYERHERGYVILLDRVRMLNRAHQLRIAIGHASSMGSHLRFGFEASYARDTIFMRDDNVADYPWLCFALATVMREIELRTENSELRTESSERSTQGLELGTAKLVEALLNGLSADARAFVGEPPSSLSTADADRIEFRDRFLARRDELLAAFEPLRPNERTYSPLSFFFNFAHNVRKGTVVDALLRGTAWPVTFNDLLTGVPAADDLNATKESLAKTLMEYARRNPDRIRGQLMPVIVYDPGAGRQAFGVTVRKLKGKR